MVGFNSGWGGVVIWWAAENKRRPRRNRFNFLIFNFLTRWQRWVLCSQASGVESAGLMFDLRVRMLMWEKKKVIMQKLLLYLRSPYIYKINSLWQLCIYLSQQAIRYLDPCETFKPNTCFFFMITSKVNVLKNLHIIPSTLLQMRSDMLSIFFLRFLDLTEIKNKSSNISNITSVGWRD